MKKLMTAFAACMIAGFVSAQVQSLNIVGYMTSVVTAGQYKIGIPSFQIVGGGTTYLNDLFDTATMAPYGAEVQLYDPLTGTFSSVFWDGTGWTADFGTTYVNVTVEPGQGYLMLFSQDTVLAGEVVNGSTLSYTHTIPSGYSIVGSAFPVAMLSSKFNFAAAFTPYGAEVQLYDPLTGTFGSAFWDGTGWTPDFGTTYLADQLAPQGEGVMFGNSMGTAIDVVESL